MRNKYLDFLQRVKTMCAARTTNMHPDLDHHDAMASDAIASRDAVLLLDQARSLQRAAAAGDLPASLRGRKLGLLCEAGDSGDAALFRRAAVELGAQVAHIRPSLTELSTLPDVRRTAYTLGRLYDAVECQGMTSDLVHQIGVHPSVPIYDGVASQKHPTAKLVNLLDGDALNHDKRRFVLQAFLLSTIA